MIRLIFTIQRETLQFIVENKTLKYTDRRWRKWISVLPKDPELKKKIIMSRNAIPLTVLKLFDFTPEEIAEYTACNDDEDLAKIVIRDAALKGCKLEKKENITNPVYL
jgi:hypothetical protein